MASSSPRLQRGLTLFELAVVIAALAVLAAIAIPNYRQHVIRLEREDAVRELRTLVQQLNGCFSRTGDYTRVDDVPNPCVTLPYVIPGGTYQLTGSISMAAFTLAAVPQGNQASDAACAGFSINQLGQQGITGNGSVQECWQSRQD